MVALGAERTAAKRKHMQIDKQQSKKTFMEALLKQYYL